MGDPIVTISEGQLQGVVKENIDGEKFCAFLGIPYAKPPTGDLRFKVGQCKLWQFAACFQLTVITANHIRLCMTCLSYLYVAITRSVCLTILHSSL